MTVRKTRRPLSLEALESRLQPGSVWPLESAGLLSNLFGPVLEGWWAAASDNARPSRIAEERNEAASGWSPGVVDILGVEQPDRPAQPVATPDGLGVELVRALFSIEQPDGPTIQEGEGVWYDLAPVPTPRQEIAVAALGLEIFVIGGYNKAVESTNVVEVYDVSTDTWRSAAPLPVVTDHAAAAVVAGTLTVIAGAPEAFFAYDPASNTWLQGPSMHYAHGGSAAVAVINDKLYVAGGYGKGMKENEVEVFDPATGTWTVLAPMQVGRNHTTGGAIDGKFYVVGGRDNKSSLPTFEVYDPATNTWSFLPELPTARSGIASGVINGCLYVFGGEIPGVFAEVEVYNPATNTWSAATSMPTPRHGIFGATIDNAIYLPGGATMKGVGVSAVHDVFVVE